MIGWSSVLLAADGRTPAPEEFRDEAENGGGRGSCGDSE